MATDVRKPLGKDENSQDDLSGWAEEAERPALEREDEFALEDEP